MKLTALSATFLLTFSFTPIFLIQPAAAFTAAQVKQVAVKYQVQSIAVLPLANSQYLVHYNIDQPPVSPASTIKLIVARVLQHQVQQGKIQLTTTVLKRSELLAYDDGGSIGNSTSVENLLHKRLQYSSNTATNLLIEKMGGLNQVTSIANKLGYRSTVLRTYLSLDRPQQEYILPNISTVRDTTKALKDLWLSNDQVAKITKLALQNADIKFGYPGEIAAKIGNNSAVVVNIGIVKIGKKYYVIGAAMNRADSSRSRRDLSAALGEIVALIDR